MPISPIDDPQDTRASDIPDGYPWDNDVPPSTEPASPHRMTDREARARLAGVTLDAQGRRQSPHHPHVDRWGAGARASAIISGHSVECAQFGTDAACAGSSAPEYDGDDPIPSMRGERVRDALEGVVLDMADDADRELDEAASSDRVAT